MAKAEFEYSVILYGTKFNKEQTDIMARFVSNASYLAEEYIKSGAWSPRTIGWLMRTPSDLEFGYEEY